MTLSFLLYFFGTCSCTPSELPDSRRLFGTRKFLPLSLFNELLSAFRSGFRCASRLLKYPRFRKGLQRYTFFLYLQIFSQLFLTFLQTFFALNAPRSLNRLYDTTLRQTRQNRKKMNKNQFSTRKLTETLFPLSSTAVRLWLPREGRSERRWINLVLPMYSESRCQ